MHNTNEWKRIPAYFGQHRPCFLSKNYRENYKKFNQKGLVIRIHLNMCTACKSSCHVDLLLFKSLVIADLCYGLWTSVNLIRMSAEHIYIKSIYATLSISSNTLFTHFDTQMERDGFMSISHFHLWLLTKFSESDLMYLISNDWDIMLCNSWFVDCMRYKPIKYRPSLERKIDMYKRTNDWAHK